ncbi:hypothetical protein SAMN05660462_02527 [Proteiniborus ethanoligenes]|uniref:Uncharacterized protein n=1 Tax=Proteiniborus ethanoligenes TaxID=415015 RepID=A0A1H3RSS5_9FIRM|nr:hypothetical protein [Proteiniborus ethanoligenes]SDZ28650.1 hypothetical protein SAMN05660462_02527 [Proteiniborus ethanoligenes]
MMVEMIYYATIVLCFFLILDLIITIIDTSSKLEWKIANITNTVFLTMLFLSVNRLIGRIPNQNVFDYLIVVFNAGLFIIGSIASKKIMKN